MSKKFGKRDGNILASFCGRISLNTYSWKNKKKESKKYAKRKDKHKKKPYWFLYAGFFVNF